jgi:hypothetical protein
MVFKNFQFVSHISASVRNTERKKNYVLLTSMNLLWIFEVFNAFLPTRVYRLPLNQQNLNPPCSFGSPKATKVFSNIEGLRSQFSQWILIEKLEISNEVTNYFITVM